MARRLAIYAHYDGQGEVKPYVRYYLEQLAPFCDELWFVSTAALDDGERDKVRPLCARVETKDNTGFDFGMWRHALDAVDLGAWDELLLSNSSMFGPIFPLVEMFDRMASVDCDFWGATDNREMDWHIQSYFLAFRRRALDSPAFAAFWRTVLPYTNKNQVIRSYEVGLSELLVENGLRGRAYVPVETLFPPWPLEALFKHKRRSATTFHPMRLIARRMPFVKADTLRDNPGKVPLRPIYRAMEKAGYDTSMVVFDRASSHRGSWARLARAIPGGRRP
jgi:lipopolysaccharide biosynthesis protein